MKKIGTCTALAVLAIQGLAAAQGRTADQVLSEMRQALGGDKLAAVKTVSGSGRTLRTNARGTTTENEFELALEWPDKYRLRTVLAAMGNMSIYRNAGFNGGQLIDEIDRPPNLSGGNVVIRFAGPGGETDPAKMTAEQKAEATRLRVLGNKRDFARLMLGLFGAPLPAFPVTISYAGEAEAPDGKADVLDVKGDGDFAARLFVDQATHRPLMLSWMDKEPIVIQAGGPGAPVPASGGTATFVHGEVRGGAMSAEERAKLEQDLEARRKEAEANRRTVEFRIYYADYRTEGGLTWPHRLQRSIDGKPSEEMIFDSLKVNAKLDPKQFQPSK